MTGPVLRATGLPHDLRKSEPYCGYETYDFDVRTADTSDSYGRYRIRLDEMYESLRIVEQCLDRLRPGPVMVADRKIAWPAQLALGPDGMGNSLDHIRHIMGDSMEALIHHFKLVTEGFQVPAGQVYAAVESPEGELGVHLVSDGGTRPYRVHFRDPSFNNLQAIAAMCEGGQLADVIVAVAAHRPGDGRRATVDEHANSDRDDARPVLARTRRRCRRSRRTPEPASIIGRYPQSDSALLPLLHLVQSEEGYVTRTASSTAPSSWD